LDDRSDRIIDAIRKFPPPEYKLDIVFTVKECLKKLSQNEYASVYLDYDLEFSEYDGKVPTGMDVVRYICSHAKLPSMRGTIFVIHSINQFGAKTMVETLQTCGFIASHIPWKYEKYFNSIIAGAFDIIHPEYIRLFKFAKEHSSFLTIALNVSPEGKKEPVLSADEREEMLYAIRYVDHVIRYHSEDELTEILTQMNSDGRLVRVMGDDHEGKSTRKPLNIPAIYKPYGEWSATKLKKLYGESVK